MLFGLSLLVLAAFFIALILSGGSDGYDYDIHSDCDDCGYDPDEDDE